MTCINASTTESTNNNVDHSTMCLSGAENHGIREQIFANATVLFPHMLKNSVTYARTGVFDPQELFQVIISSSGSKFKAILVGGVTVAKKAIARGPEADCVVGALSGLLKILTEAMGWYTETLVGEIENSEETESGGQVNLGMVEDGFHFAHVQHWAQGKNNGRL